MWDVWVNEMGSGKRVFCEVGSLGLDGSESDGWDARAGVWERVTGACGGDRGVG